jgi:drug/metabolite transporter (DMT)-like permease
MPISAMQGAVAAVIGVAAGESIGTIGAIGIALTLVGLYGAMRAPHIEEARAEPAALALAVASAVFIGLGFYASSRAGTALGTAWTVVSLRIAGVLALVVPLAALGRFPRPRAAAPFVLFSGIADVVAITAYVYASSHAGVIVPAVLASQAAVVTALLGMIALGERPTRVQLSGICAILVGVAIVTASQS